MFVLHISELRLSFINSWLFPYVFTGIMLGAWPCGTIVLLGELFGAESNSQVYALLHTFFLRTAGLLRTSVSKGCMLSRIKICCLHMSFSIAEYVCYDDGCHLKKYVMNPIRVKKTETASRLASTKIVIDKLHFKGHTDAWCKEHCDPYKFKDLNEVHLYMALYCIELCSW